MNADTGSTLAQASEASGEDGDILCLYYPQQVLSAVAAVITHRRRHGVDPARPVHALLWSDAVHDGVRASRSAVTETMLGAFSWVRLWSPTRAELDRHLSPRRRVAAKARFFRERFRDVAVGAVYYPHDLTSDFLAHSAAHAFPQARRVCFGDGFGTVYSRAYFERHVYSAATMRGLLKTPGTALRHRLAKLRRTWARRDTDLQTDTYVLILPHDPTGECLSTAEVVVVPYDCARDVLTSLTATVRSRALSAVPALFGDAPAAPVLLLGSFAESRMCAERDELALYRAVLRTHVPPGNGLVLKPHAATSVGKLERLMQSIGSDYDVRVLDRELAQVPIELLDVLVDGRLVLSFSHASVALTYFQLGEVRHIMTKELIERFFPPSIRPWMAESNEWYLQQQRAAREARPLLGPGR